MDTAVLGRRGVKSPFEETVEVRNVVEPAGESYRRDGAIRRVRKLKRASFETFYPNGLSKRGLRRFEQPVEITGSNMKSPAYRFN